MTRPTVLDMDLVVVPAKADVGMIGAWYRYKNGHRFAGEEPARDTSDVGAYSAMLSASPYPTAWDDVQKYVYGLEGERDGWMRTVGEFVATIPSREIVANSGTVRDTVDYFKALHSRAEAAEARIAELEKRLVDAERVIEPFAAEAACYDPDTGDSDDILWATPAYFKIRNLRAARAYMEGK